MPATAVTARRPEGAALDRAIAEATAMARDYAIRAAGRAVGDPIATTLAVKGSPENAPLGWDVAVTITFSVGP
jgi:hypothetical protein